MSASERMKEPGSFAGAPKWMKLGTGLCAVEGDGRDHRISQPNLRCKSGRGLVYGCDGYALCAFICNIRRRWRYRSSQARRRKGGN